MDASSRFKGEPLGSLLVGQSFVAHLAGEIPERRELDRQYHAPKPAGVQGNDNLGSYYAWQSLYDMNYPNANQSGAVNQLDRETG